MSGCLLHLCHPPHPLPSGPSAHELCVALGTCYYDIHPDPHGLWGWSHHVVEPIVGFYAESQRRIGALEGHREKGRHFKLKTASCTCCVFFFWDIKYKIVYVFNSQKQSLKISYLKHSHFYVPHKISTCTVYFYKIKIHMFKLMFTTRITGKAGSRSSLSLSKILHILSSMNK